MPGLPDITKCLSSVMDIPGCIAEISQSIFTRKFGNLGPACCKTFLDIESNCMPKIPFIPLFSPMLKEQCSRIAGATPLTPK
ncbi:putative Prolamin-like domain-containing protein [Arabidopsis thaliana]